jgi:8-oxo-dGTP diphosphatase
VPRATVLDGHYLDVVAGILLAADGRVLIAERTGDRPFNGMWEFPGGKIGAGESRQQALTRELAEELGIVVQKTNFFMSLEHDYPDRSVRLHFFKITGWSGDPSGLEGQEIQWLLPADIEDGLMLPADAPVIKALLK